MALRRLFLFLILIITLSSSCASTLNTREDLLLYMGDYTLPQGGVAVFRLSGAKENRGLKSLFTTTPETVLNATFTGGVVFTFESDAVAWGIVAVDLGTKPGIYELTLKKGTMDLKTFLEVIDGDYGTERLSLPKGMVELDKKALKRVKEEARLISTLWESSSSAPLFRGPFIMPVSGRVSGRFGTRRVLNGSPRSPHSGIDFAAPEGTNVKAANDGKVAFIGDFFFKGKFVVIDHGLGVFTSYSHLSAISIETRQSVKKGETIGKVGATGRATGPHLHFSVKVGGARVSPTRLFKEIERLGVFSEGIGLTLADTPNEIGSIH